MSKNAGGYMGIQIGKLGPAVGSMWKGKNVYRSYNPFVKPPPHSWAARAESFSFFPHGDMLPHVDGQIQRSL